MLFKAFDSEYGKLWKGKELSHLLSLTISPTQVRMFSVKKRLLGADKLNFLNIHDFLTLVHRIKKLYIQEISCFPLIFILDYLLSDDTEGHNCTLLSGWLPLRGSWIAQPTSCSFSQIIKRTGLCQNRLLKHPAGCIKQPSSLGQALPKTPDASSCLRTTRVYCCCASTPASSFISFSLSPIFLHTVDQTGSFTQNHTLLQHQRAGGWVWQTLVASAYGRREKKKDQMQWEVIRGKRNISPSKYTHVRPQ